MNPLPVLSASAIKCYKHCPGSYKDKYIAKGKPKTGDLTGIIPGNVSHKVVETAFKAGQDPKTKVIDGSKIDRSRFTDDALVEVLMHQQLKNPRVNISGPDSWAKGVDDAKAQLLKFRDFLVAALEREELIKPFMLSEFWFGAWNKPFRINAELQVSGGFDLFSADSRTSPGRLIDFKASPNDSNQDPDQLRLYAMVMARMGLNVAMAGFLTFRIGTPPVRYYSFPREELQEAEERFVQIGRKIVAGEFPYTPSKSACRYCDFREHCPIAWKDDGKKNNKLSVQPAVVALPDPIDTPEL